MHVRFLMLAALSFALASVPRVSLAQSDADFVWQRAAFNGSFVRQSASAIASLWWSNNMSGNESEGLTPDTDAGDAEETLAEAGHNVYKELRDSTNNAIVLASVEFFPDEQPVFGASAIINSTVDADLRPGEDENSLAGGATWGQTDIQGTWTLVDEGTSMAASRVCSLNYTVGWAQDDYGNFINPGFQVDLGLRITEANLGVLLVLNAINGSDVFVQQRTQEGFEVDWVDVGSTGEITGEVIATINVDSTVTVTRDQAMTDPITQDSRASTLGVGMTGNAMESDGFILQAVNASIVALEFEMYSYTP